MSIEFISRPMQTTCKQCNKLKPYREFPEKTFHTENPICYCCLREALSYIDAVLPKRITKGRQYRHAINYELKDACHKAASKAIYEKVLVPQPCEVCKGVDTHGHHSDYSKPLEVNWLCPKHHFAWHVGKLSLPITQTP